MAEFREAGLARSLAGHDKNELYIIISVRGEYVFVSDGRKHPLEKLKRKNKKHLQLIDEQDETIREKLTEGKAVRNEEIIKAIRAYKQ
jgi:ribosomal protein L14E/L6E/L27E